MAKLKLKTVQNGTEVENPNLMESGSYDYVDCSGYVIIGSGVYDNSGNLVEEGWIQIDSGNECLHVGDDPMFQMEVSWDSGVFNLPLHSTIGTNGYEPYVSFTHEAPVIERSTHIVGNDISVSSYGETPLCIRLTIEYTIFRGYSYIHDTATTLFYIPFGYHKPGITEK